MNSSNSKTQYDEFDSSDSQSDSKSIIGVYKVIFTLTF